MKEKFYTLAILFVLTILTACNGSDQPGSTQVTDPGGNKDEPTLPIDPIVPKGVAVYFDGRYVDVNPNAIDDAEADNLRRAMLDQGHEVSTFTGLTPTRFRNGLSNKAVFILPELERGFLNGALSLEAKAVIADFVNEGGTMIAFNSHTSTAATDSIADRTRRVINTTFGFSLETINFAAPITRNSDAQLAFTPFENCGPEELGLNVYASGATGIHALATPSLPQGSKIIYKDSNGNAIVTLIPYGQGNLVILGWEYRRVKPIGRFDGGWRDILYRAARLHDDFPKVAALGIVANQNFMTDMHNMLKSSCQFESVDSIDLEVTTVDLAKLQTYDSVIVWKTLSTTPGILEKNSFGNALADYVDSGGGVVVSGGFLRSSNTSSNHNVGGRFLSDDYYIYAKDFGRSNHQSGESSVLTLATHPLNAGLINGGTTSDSPLIPIVFDPGVGSMIMNWSSGETMVVSGAVNNVRRIDLGFSPTTIGAGGLQGGVGRIISNSLSWVAGYPKTEYASYSMSDRTAVPANSSVTSLVQVDTGPTQLSDWKIRIHVDHIETAALTINLIPPDTRRCTRMNIINNNTSVMDGIPNLTFSRHAAKKIVDVTISDLDTLRSIMPADKRTCASTNSNGEWQLEITNQSNSPASLVSWELMIR